MAYGIKMYNRYGHVNISDEGGKLRVHQSKIVTVPARVLAAPFTPATHVTTLDTPIGAWGVVELTDLGAVITDLNNWGLYALFTFVEDGHYTEVTVVNSGISAHDVRWTVWTQI